MKTRARVGGKAGSRTSTQRRGSATGEYNTEAQRGNKTGNHREKGKVKKTKLYFSIYLIALKYCLYINRRKKMENHRFFLKYVFLKMGTSPKSSFFQRMARGLRPNDGVVQRGPQ